MDLRRSSHGRRACSYATDSGYFCRDCEHKGARVKRVAASRYIAAAGLYGNHSVSEHDPRRRLKALQVFYCILLSSGEGTYVLRCLFHITEELFRYLGVCRFYLFSADPEARSVAAVESQVIAQKSAVTVLDNVPYYFSYPDFKLILLLCIFFN